MQEVVNYLKLVQMQIMINKLAQILLFHHIVIGPQPHLIQLLRLIVCSILVALIIKVKYVILYHYLEAPNTQFVCLKIINALK